MRFPLCQFLVIFFLLPMHLMGQQKNTKKEGNSIFTSKPISCASSVATQLFLEKHPTRAEDIGKMNGQLNRRILDPLTEFQSTLELPLVFHVIHQNGAENISDSQIQSAIQNLNDAFAHQNYFAQTNLTGHNTEIQFCLAKQDPFGNQTTGINRIQSPLTQMQIESEDLHLKNLSRWKPTDYINIWIVNSIKSISTGDGVAGYAYLPFVHGEAIDGIVMEANFVGTTPAQTSVLIHEMGHYLGLYHTFEGGCKNDDCTTDGDRVCDTPPDQAQHTTCPYNSCGTDSDAAAPNPFSTDVDDRTDNFMDYAPLDCYRTFTAGQGARMQTVIRNIRSSLLESKGCENPCMQLIVSDFTASTSLAAVGETVDFTNQSSGATDYTWKLGPNILSHGLNTTFSFPTEGLFSIKLIAENSNPSCIDSIQKNMKVACPVIADFFLEKTEIVLGESLVSVNNSINAISYSWFFDNTNIGSGNALPNVIAPTGTHTIKLLASDGYCENEMSVQITVLPDCSGGICPEICNNGIDDDADGFVDCYDADCTCFTGADCSVTSVPNNFTMAVDWQSQKDEVAVNSVPMVANLNPQTDTIPEVIVLTSTGQVSSQPGDKVLIFKGNGTNAGVPDELAIPKGYDAYPMTHPAIGDVDGDGIPELVMVEYDGRVRVYKDYQPNQTPAMSLWLESDSDAWNRNARPALADFDGDGTPEIYTGNVVFKFNFSDINLPKLERFGAGIGPVGRGIYRDFQERATLSTAADVLSVADCAGDPDCAGLELIAGHVMYSVDLDASDGDGIQIKVQKDLKNLHQSNAWKDGYTAVADMDLDGTPDVVVSGGRGNKYGVYIWNKYGLLRFMQYENGTNLSGSIPCIANVFDDKTTGAIKDYPEVIACNHKQLTCFNLNAAKQNPQKPWWWRLATTDASGLTGSSVFDFNGDGFQEIVYRDEEHLRILYGGSAPFPQGVDTERNWYRIPTGSGTFDEYPVVADLDADGEAEIAVTGYMTSGVGSPITDYRGRLRVFGSGASPWVPARQVWNQTNYSIVNVNDDLSIPKEQQAHWLEFPMIGSENRPFNAHLGQMPGLDEEFHPYYPVPDAALILTDLFCENQMLRVEFDICNYGSFALPLGTPIQFYDGNPTTSTAQITHTEWLLPKSIDIDSCAHFHVEIPITGNLNIWAFLNDNASLNTPFNPSTDFPSTTQPECDYSNNLFHIQYEYSPTSLDLGVDKSLCGSSVLELTAPIDFEKYRWSDGSQNPTFTATAPSTVWLDVWDKCGIHSVDTVQFFLENINEIELPEQLDLCLGDTITLQIEGFDALQWAPENRLACATCTSIFIKADSSMALHVTGKKSSCFSSDSTQIIVHPLPKISLTADTLACADLDGAMLSAFAQNGAAPYQFLWSDGAETESIQATTAGIYQLLVTDAQGCSDTINHELEAPTPLHFSTKTDSIDCYGETGAISLDLISGAAPIQYFWSNGNTAQNLDNILADTYIIEAIDSLQCRFYDTIQLSQPPALNLDYQVDTLNCQKKKGAIFTTISGGTKPYTYDWHIGQTGAHLFAAVADDYRLTVTDKKGCLLKDTLHFFMDTLAPSIDLGFDTIVIPCTADEVLLNGNYHPNYNYVQTRWRIIQNDSTIWVPNQTELLTKDGGWHLFQAENTLNHCLNTDSIFVHPAPAIDDVSTIVSDVTCFGKKDASIQVKSISGGQSPFIYRLASLPSQTSPEFFDLDRGTYELHLEDKYGCTWNGHYTIQEPPPFFIDLSTNKTSIEAGEPLHLGATLFPEAHPIKERIWFPVWQFSLAKTWQQTIYPKDSLEVGLLVIDSFGCPQSDSRKIHVAQVDVYLPNIIDPDIDQNAYFTVYSARDVERVLRMDIYNRWGGLLFSNTDFAPNVPLEGWDGMQHGKVAQSGVYLYEVEVLMKNRKRRLFRGDLLRL